MKYDPNKHHRRSIRLKGYDYTQPGFYFVTICVQNRECLLGKIENAKMKLNTFGKIIEYHWEKIPHHFPHIKLDQYQIMPNHFHGIVQIIAVPHSPNQSVRAQHSGIDKINRTENYPRNVRAKHFNHDSECTHTDHSKNASPQQGQGQGQGQGRNRHITNTTNDNTANPSPHPPNHPTGTQPGSLAAVMQNFQSITSRKTNRIRKTPGARLWQRNYWEHIVRNEPELNRIRTYIRNNPAKWKEDSLRPGNDPKE